MLSCARPATAPFGAGRAEGLPWSRWCWWCSGCSVGAIFLADQATIRAESFIWPAVETALGMGVVAALTWMHRRSERGRVTDGSVACRQPVDWPESRCWHARRPFSSPPVLRCGRRARRRSRRRRRGGAEERGGVVSGGARRARCASSRPDSAYPRTPKSRTGFRSWPSTIR